MALELEGKLVRKLAVQRGVSARGSWAKQEFVIEYQDGNFPSQACFNVWGEDKIKDLERFSAGASVKVSFAVNSREFNGRWYTDLRAWRIEDLSSAASAAGANQAVSVAAAAPASPADSAPFPAGDFDFSEDDLPF